MAFDFSDVITDFDEEEDNDTGGVLSLPSPQRPATENKFLGGLLNFIQSPDALALSTGLLNSQSPYFSDAMGAGFQNVFDMRKKSSGAAAGTFGKALSDYHATLAAYGENHPMTILAKENLTRVAQGSPGMEFSMNPDGTATFKMGGRGGSTGSSGAVVDPKTGKMVTPPTGQSTSDMQAQKIAKTRMEILNPHLEHDYVGSGTNIELANDILKYRKNPTPELKEKLIKAVVADKLIGFGANLSNISEGGGTGVSATREQKEAMRKGWAEGLNLAEKNMPKEVIQEATRRAAQIKREISEVSEKEYATGYAIKIDPDTGMMDLQPVDDVRGSVQDVTKKDLKMNSFATDKSAREYLKSLGYTDAGIDKVIKSSKLSIQELASRVLLEMEG